MATYGSIAGVAAYVQHTTDDGLFPTVATPTVPALATVQLFLNQRSAVLAGWIAAAGYIGPVAQADAKAALDMYANLGTAGDVELSMASAGYDEQDQNRRENKFLSLFAQAQAWIASDALRNMGVTSIEPIATTTVQPTTTVFTRESPVSDFQAEATGIEAVNAGLARVAQAGQTAQQTVLHDLGGEYVAALVRETPHGQGPEAGALQQGYKTEEHYTDTSGEFHITNDVPHLKYVLAGRGAVKATNGKALRFQIGSTVIFRRSVGPAAANNFPPRARAAMQPQIDAAAGQMAGFVVKVFDA